MIALNLETGEACESTFQIRSLLVLRHYDSLYRCDVPRDYHCYYLQMMKDDPNLNTTIMDAVNSTWERVNCSLSLACCYTGSPPQQQFIKPTSCPRTSDCPSSGQPAGQPSGQPSGQSTRPSDRTKRSTKRGQGGGPVLGTAGQAPAPAPLGPPTPNADANAYAKFLVKYMALDSKTRRRIEHQVLFIIV